MQVGVGSLLNFYLVNLFILVGNLKQIDKLRKTAGKDDVVGAFAFTDEMHNMISVHDI